MLNRSRLVTSDHVREDDRITLDVIAFAVVTTISIVMLIYYVGSI
jgi:hypothetical protein